MKKSIFDIYTEGIRDFSSEIVQRSIEYAIKKNNNFDAIEALAICSVLFEKTPDALRELANDRDIDFLDHTWSYLELRPIMTRLEKFSDIDVEFEWCTLPLMQDDNFKAAESTLIWDDIDEVSESSMSSQINLEVAGGVVPEKRTYRVPKNDYFENNFSHQKDLSNISMAFTGNLRCFGRDQVAKFVRDSNGIYHKNVKKTTNFLIVADSEPGKTKLKMAEKYKIPKLNEDEFYAFLDKYETVCASHWTSILGIELKDEIQKRNDRKQRFNSVLNQLKDSVFELI